MNIPRWIRLLLGVSDHVERPHALLRIFENLTNIRLAAQPIDILLNTLLNRPAWIPADRFQFAYVRARIPCIAKPKDPRNARLDLLSTRNFRNNAVEFLHGIRLSSAHVELMANHLVAIKRQQICLNHIVVIDKIPVH